MVSAALILLSAALSADVEIGDERKTGVGVAVGFPPSVTGKHFFDPKNGLSFHLGPAIASTGLHTRLQFEQEAANLGDWDFGRLGLTWNVGVIVGFIFGQNRQIRPGLSLGAGLELQLAPAPAAVFVEVSPSLYPLEFLGNTPFLPVGLTLAGGGRWYF